MPNTHEPTLADALRENLMRFDATRETAIRARIAGLERVTPEVQMEVAELWEYFAWSGDLDPAVLEQLWASYSQSMDPPTRWLYVSATSIRGFMIWLLSAACVAVEEHEAE